MVDGHSNKTFVQVLMGGLDLVNEVTRSHVRGTGRCERCGELRIVGLGPSGPLCPYPDSCPEQPRQQGIIILRARRNIDHHDLTCELKTTCLAVFSSPHFLN